MIVAIITILCLSVLGFKIESTGNFIQEDNGRVKIFHGVNIVVKLPPYFPTTENFDPYTSLTEKDIYFLKKLGFNVVRLGIIWESIEREEGSYDYEHLEKMSDIVQKFEENDIAVIIDAHQDMFSRTFCGEGVPQFYVNKLFVERECSSNILSQIFKILTACLPLGRYKWDYDEKGLPLIKDCQTKGRFIDYHRSPELTTVYDSFYKNQNGIIDSFADFWSVLAQKFAGRKNVLGYDLWNEPWPANLWSDIRSLIPGYTDNHVLTNFYKKMDERINQYDPNYILLFEPVPFPDTLPLFGGKVLHTFDKAPIDLQKRQQVFNVHNYCCQAGPSVCDGGEPTLKDADGLCPKFHEEKVKKNQIQARAMGVPLIVTEFGACSDSEACYLEILGFVKAADNYLVSWNYWMYKPFGDHTTTAKENTEGVFNSDGTVQSFKERALTRTYIQSYQGYPLSMQFNDETIEFNSSFILNNQLIDPSVIYINRQLFYPNGYDLEITSSTGEEIDVDVQEIDDNHISFYIKTKGEMTIKVLLISK